MNYFFEKLEYSLGAQKKFDCEILKSHIPKCVSVIKTDTETDKTGIDYIATLKGGAEIYIDAKTRVGGCSKYWDGQPELCIETWSVKEKAIPGWTYKESTKVDYILYTFAPEDYSGYFFIPFQLLRAAAIRHYHEWVSRYKEKPQRNMGYTSMAVFVPADVVLNAVREQMEGEVMTWVRITGQ